MTNERSQDESSEVDASGSSHCSTAESRTFKAWSIFWKWTDTGLITPVFKEIGGSFPWFRSKRAAEQFMREVKRHRKGEHSKLIEWHVRPIVLTMEYDCQ